MSARVWAMPPLTGAPYTPLVEVRRLSRVEIPGGELCDVRILLPGQSTWIRATPSQVAQAHVLKLPMRIDVVTAVTYE